MIERKPLIDKLQKLQIRALKICFGKPNIVPSFPLHCKSSLLSLDLRRKCSLLSYMNLKLIKNDSTFILDARTDNRTRRSNEMMKIPFPRNEWFKCSISYAGPKLWNDVPFDYRKNHMTDSFKSNVRNDFWTVFNNRQTVK